MNNELIKNIDKIHTTELGTFRIKHNLNLETENVVNYCKSKIEKSEEIYRKGKNWYIITGKHIFTVNINSYTIITAHIIK
jgi:hypothetical protein